MVRIGIELNNIIRNFNASALKFYIKGIDKEFDEEKIDLNKVNISNDLPFNTKKDRYNFFYIDYPYEVYGTAKCMSRNLSVYLNNWIAKLDDVKKNYYDVKYFSLMENALTIQSTYFFLSKIGARVRKMFFPKDGNQMWDECDVIITTNDRIVNSKPQGKVVVLIKKSDNEKLVDKADYVYNNLEELLNDTEFLSKIENVKIETLYARLINKIKKMFNIDVKE